MADLLKRVWTSKGPLGRKVKKTSWGYTVQVNGKQERKFDAVWTENDARDALSRRLKAIEAGRLTRPADATLAALADEYLSYKSNQQKRSLKEDRRIIKTRLLPAFGADLLLRRLSESLIAQYEKKRAGEVSAFTVSNELSVLRHMLRLGRKWGYVEQVPEIELPKKPEGRQRYLDEDEITRLLTACEESKNPYLRTIVTLALNTGMRKGEILGLAWEQVDLSTARLTLYKTKSGKPRGVPINRAVYEALVALEPDAKQRQGLLFKRHDGAAWGQIRTAFAVALKKAKIEGFRFHDLRHTAASHMVMRGATLKKVQEILGHSDFKMTLRYAHLSPSHLRGAVDRLDGLTPVASVGSAHDSAQSGKIRRSSEQSVSEVA